jgi:hypothetical protein
VAAGDALFATGDDRDGGAGRGTASTGVGNEEGGLPNWRDSWTRPSTTSSRRKSFLAGCSTGDGIEDRNGVDVDVGGGVTVGFGEGVGLGVGVGVDVGLAVGVGLGVAVGVDVCNGDSVGSGEGSNDGSSVGSVTATLGGCS